MTCALRGQMKIPMYLITKLTLKGKSILILVFGTLFINSNSFANARVSNAEIEIASFSFNAKKRSSFIVAGIKEQVERGLTLIHFYSNDKFEFKTFDTYSSVSECQKLVGILSKMNKNRALYAILAHDSAANNWFSNNSEIKTIGLHQLATLKNRQAYIMSNINGTVVENVNDIELTIKLQLPKEIEDEHIYFPKITYDFEPSTDRYIAHGGGEINKVRYTNTREALDYSYQKGFRLFELDIIETSDGKWVAAHDWNMWSRFTDYQGSLPPTLAEFNKEVIYGDYHTMDLSEINDWFEEHEDATLVTDKVNEPIAFAEAFIDKKRLIMELFSQLAIEEALQNGIKVMMSQEPLMKLKGDKTDYLNINNIEYVAVSRRIISSKKELLLKFKENGIKVYVYNVNFDPGKDEKYVYDNELGLVYGMYADKWVFDPDSTSKTAK